jgi:hypothetical protein
MTITVDSVIEELAPGCFHEQCMAHCTFAEPSHLRVIGQGAFQYCRFLAGISIPRSVEVIGRNAFLLCGAFQEVRIASGSKLRLIEEGAFKFCGYLQSVDVPSRATVREEFEFIATVYDQDGAERSRVKFT